MELASRSRRFFTSEESIVSLFGQRYTFVGQGDGFALADRIGNQTFCVETLQGVPVEAFPGAGNVVGAFNPMPKIEKS